MISVIIIDDKDLAEATADFLKFNGFDVVIVPDELDVIRLFKKTHSGVIILQMSVTKCDELSAIKKIKEIDSEAEIFSLSHSFYSKAKNDSIHKILKNLLN